MVVCFVEISGIVDDHYNTFFHDNINYQKKL